jgi:TatD DNase family protein
MAEATIKTLPKFIDTHIHLDYIMDRLERPLTELPSLFDTHFASTPLVKGKVVERSGEWEGCVHITCDPVTFAAARELMKIDRIYVGAGVHPHHAKDYSDEVEAELKELHKSDKVVAWGEMGLDYHYNQSPPEVQRQVFARQLKTAISLGKPMIIHTREAEDDTYRIMTEIVPADWKIHIHCFTSKLEFAKNLMAFFPNLVFGFTGVVTFGNAQDVQQVVQHVPIERIVLETDGPFLAPAPFRGMVATSGMISKIADKIASLKGVPVEDVYQHARKNTTKIYSI